MSAPPLFVLKALKCQPDKLTQTEDYFQSVADGKGLELRSVSKQMNMGPWRLHAGLQTLTGFAKVVSKKLYELRYCNIFFWNLHFYSRVSITFNLYISTQYFFKIVCYFLKFEPNK